MTEETPHLLNMIISDVDFEDILKDYDWLHLSGITPALSYNCRRMIDKAVKVAKKLGLDSQL